MSSSRSAASAARSIVSLAPTTMSSSVQAS
jgi:hypothetical protein